MASNQVIREFTDQTSRIVKIHGIPQRIVSVVPSQTELLYDLGLNNRIVGQTWFCVHPSEAFRTAQKVGGTKRLNLEKIRALNPDFILANKEENDKAQIESLAVEFPVWVSDIFAIKDALSMIQSVGDITATEQHANNWIQLIQSEFESLKDTHNPQKVLYLIWRKPWMAAGRNTFINSMIEGCGWQNVLADATLRYPELSDKTLEELKPDVVLLSSEPYPFVEKHIQQIQMLLPNAKIQLVNGEMFSWYGSRLAQAPRYFKTLIAGQHR